MLYFLTKAGEIAAALGTPPPNPLGLRQLPQVVTFTQLTCYFWVLLRLLGIVKNRTYYLILERRLVGPLSQACPASWLKPLVTPLTIWSCIWVDYDINSWLQG